MAYVKCLRGINGSEIPEGSTATPTDVVETLLNCAGIFDKEYTTIAQLLADTTSLNTVITSNNAIDYLVRSTTFATAVTADQTAMSYIGLNNYASNTLLGDATWCSAICNSTYFESVLNVKVPVMTSNTTPSGECFASSYRTTGVTRPPYYAFNGDDTTLWQGADGQNYPQYLGYTFSNSMKLKKVRLINQSGSDSGVEKNLLKDIIIQGSNDGFSSDINNIKSVTLENRGGKYTDDIVIDNNTAYNSCRVYFVNTWQSNTSALNCATSLLQFYGRADV